MSRHSDSEEEDLSKNFAEAFESSQICFRFAEEIRVLRSELLALKQEKRQWLSSNHLSELSNKNDYIRQLKLEILQLNDVICSDRKRHGDQDDVLKRLQGEQTDKDLQLHKALIENASLTETLKRESERVKELTRQLQKASDDEEMRRKEFHELQEQLLSAKRTVDEHKQNVDATHQSHRQILASQSAFRIQQDALSEKAHSLFQLVVSACEGNERAEAEDWLGTHGIVTRGLPAEESWDKTLVVIHASRMIVKKLLARYDRQKVYMRKLIAAVRESDCSALLALEESGELHPVRK